MADWQLKPDVGIVFTKHFTFQDDLLKALSGLVELVCERHPCAGGSEFTLLWFLVRRVDDSDIVETVDSSI